jgi:hypothetical protein
MAGGGLQARRFFLDYCPAVIAAAGHLFGFEPVVNANTSSRELRCKLA